MPFAMSRWRIKSPFKSDYELSKIIYKLTMRSESFSPTAYQFPQLCYRVHAPSKPPVPLIRFDKIRSRPAANLPRIGPQQETPFRGIP